MSKRPRVLVVHNDIQPHGGACGVLAWTLQALRRDYEVTLLTTKPFDLPALNRFFGTSLDPIDMHARYIPAAIRKILALDPDAGSIQPYCYLMRNAKRLRPDFDCAVTTNNEADLGLRAVQYVHAPSFEHLYGKVTPNLDLSFSRKFSAWREGKVRPWMALADFSFDRMKQNRTIVNSGWTGNWVRRLYKIETVTLYPPAAGDFPDIPWEARQVGFVVLGRLNPLKRPDLCLRALQIVRQSFPGIELHIVGGKSNFEDEVAYYKELMPLVAANSSWVTLHENISRRRLEELIAHQRYGMHAMVEEPFGMAVAEMVRAGCLPFVHNSGGPPEIVGYDARLLYESVEEAAEKIMTVLANASVQSELRAKLSLRKSLFSPDAFVAGIRAEVGEMIRRG